MILQETMEMLKKTIGAQLFAQWHNFFAQSLDEQWPIFCEFTFHNYFDKYRFIEDNTR